MAKTMQITLRPAGEEDLPAILAIYNAAIRDTNAVYTETPATLAERRAWLHHHEAMGYPVLVALANPSAQETTSATVAGFASFSPFRPWPGFRHTVEHSVYVSPDWQGHGIGGKLVQALLEEAKRLDKHVMVAGIDAGNPASIRLHEKLGFEKVGLMPEVGCKFGAWLSLQWMQKTLSH